MNPKKGEIMNWVVRSVEIYKKKVYNQHLYGGYATREDAEKFMTIEIPKKNEIIKKCCSFSTYRKWKNLCWEIVTEETQPLIGFCLKIPEYFPNICLNCANFKEKETKN